MNLYFAPYIEGNRGTGLHVIWKSGGSTDSDSRIMFVDDEQMVLVDLSCMETQWLIKRLKLDVKP